MNSPILSSLPADSADLADPAEAAESNMGTLLLDAGKLTPEGAERALRMQKDLGIRFGEAAVRLGLVSEDDVQEALARQFAYPYLPKGQAHLSPRLVAAYDPFSPQVESLRAIRSQLMLRWFARGRRALESDDLYAGVLEGVMAASGGEPAQLCFNFHNPVVRRLAAVPDREVMKLSVEMLYVQALLLGQHPLNAQEMALLNQGLLGLISAQLGEEGGDGGGSGSRGGFH